MNYLEQRLAVEAVAAERGHVVMVPAAGGVPPMCSCGFVGGWRPGETAVDHLDAVAEERES